MSGFSTCDVCETLDTCTDGQTCDMANVGREIVNSLAKNMPGWHPADCPSEVVTDLLNQVHDLKAELARVRAASERRLAFIAKLLRERDAARGNQ